MDGFYGSTDSAMPCSIMLKVADSITSDVLNQKVSICEYRVIKCVVWQVTYVFCKL
ncbi:hypothetical protein EG68_12453 [Paragonimus skrjabini miyazakii]|uniref:Uncharacterized protein n=1 Tax=Paragonimus skrjabini miyazakii TaxID=59628 RepID=A0A8S9YI35_9TREM|nr:hypothetical protein EG68_12453 [Paragonimus skrjabini miyazakii]